MKTNGLEQAVANFLRPTVVDYPRLVRASATVSSIAP